MATWIPFKSPFYGCSGGNGVKIYDLRQTGTGRQEPIVSLKSRSTGVNSLSWSPHGHLLAGGCESGMTYLWDVRHPGKEMVTLRQQEKNPVQVYNTHLYYIIGVCQL